MSELVWGIKNGDLDQVKDIVEKKVSRRHSPKHLTAVGGYLSSYDANLQILH